MKSFKIASLYLFALGLLFIVGCTSSNIRDAAPGEERANAVEQERDDVRTVARNTLQELYAKQPQAKQAVENAAGHAVFSNFGMKILVAGGGTGKGVAVNKAGREIFMRMAEVQAGLGFGVKKFRLVWVFETQGAFDTFVNQGYEFGGQATLAAQAGGQGAGYAGAMSVSPGVWVYQITDDGLAAELTVKGTKYYRDKDLN
jgi:lipid-binding SYLF domain-containing protein